jgi:hypothetical protein
VISKPPPLKLEKDTRQQVAFINYSNIGLPSLSPSSDQDGWANIKQVNMSPVEPNPVLTTTYAIKSSKALELKERLKRIQKLTQVN